MGKIFVSIQSPYSKILIQKPFLIIKSLQRSCWNNHIKFGIEMKISNFDVKNKEGEKLVSYEGPRF